MGKGKGVGKNLGGGGGNSVSDRENTRGNTEESRHVLGLSRRIES